MWLPVVMTSAPAAWSSRAVSVVRPAPPAAFSPFTIARSMRSSSRSFGSSAATASRPGRPTTSPTNRMRIALFGVVDGARLPNDGDLDLARVLKGVLDLLGHVAREPRGMQIVDLARFDHHADLAAG